MRGGRNAANLPRKPEQIHNSNIPMQVVSPMKHNHGQYILIFNIFFHNNILTVKFMFSSTTRREYRSYG